jgi:hypothetical protein
MVAELHEMWSRRALGQWPRRLTWPLGAPTAGAARRAGLVAEADADVSHDVVPCTGVVEDEREQQDQPSMPSTLRGTSARTEKMRP